MNTTKVISALTLALLVLLAAPVSFGQTPGYQTNSNDTGMPNYGSFITSKIDSVNLANGGVSIHLPLFSRKGRGAGLDFNWGYRYESKYWAVDMYVVAIPGQPPVTHYHWRPDFRAGLWQDFSTLGGGVDWVEQLYTCVNHPNQFAQAPTYIIRSNWVFMTPDGSKHQLPLRKRYMVTNPDVCYDYDTWDDLVAETDNGHTRIDITNDPWQYGPRIFTATLRDGSKVGNWFDNFVQKDTNGNYFQGNLDANGFELDTLGRPLLRGRVINGTTGGEDYYDSNGNLQTMTVEMMTIQVATSFGTAGPDQYHVFDEFSGPITVVKKITLANGLAYTFSYEDPDHPGQTNPYGEVTKISLPTGGYIKYRWATLGSDPGPYDPSLGYAVDLPGRMIVERRVSEDGANEQVWHYFSSGATVIDPLGNREIHYFGGCQIGYAPVTPLEAQVDYQKPDGTPLRRVTTDWACDTGPLYSSQPGSDLPTPNDMTTIGARNMRVIRTTTDAAGHQSGQQDGNRLWGLLLLHRFVDEATPIAARILPRSANTTTAQARPGPLVRYTNSATCITAIQTISMRTSGTASRKNRSMTPPAI